MRLLSESGGHAKHGRSRAGVGWLGLAGAGISLLGLPACSGDDNRATDSGTATPDSSVAMDAGSATPDGGGAEDSGAATVDGPASVDDADASPSTDAGADTGASPSVDAGADSVGGSYGGAIGFEDLELPSLGDQYAVTASFGGPLDPAPTGCPGGTQVQSCCFQGNGAPASTGATPAVSAGTIAVTDGTASLGMLTFTTRTVGTMTVGAYGPITANAPPSLWQGGDTLGVSAAGATIAAFSGTLRAPPAIAGIAPDYTAQPRPTTARTQDLLISWTTDTVTGESMVFATALSTGNPAIITCTVDDSAGTLTVAASILGMLPGGSQTLDVSLTRLVQTNVAAANATVRLAAIAVRPGTIIVQ